MRERKEVMKLGSWEDEKRRQGDWKTREVMKL
jgi:hypothetical protein